MTAVALKQEARTRAAPVTQSQKRHVVEQRSEFHFAVLGPNPGFNKPGVCYSGEYFTICTTDGPEEAKRIAKALDLLQAVESLGEAPVLAR
jgi:hypothetical protein